MKRITIIVPCFNEEENIGRLCQKITEMTLLQPQYSWKTLFVDDGSTDGTIEKIIAEREKNGEFRSFVNFINRMASGHINKKQLECCSAYT